MSSLIKDAFIAAVAYKLFMTVLNIYDVREGLNEAKVEQAKLDEIDKQTEHFKEIFQLKVTIEMFRNANASLSEQLLKREQKTTECSAEIVKNSEIITKLIATLREKENTIRSNDELIATLKEKEDTACSNDEHSKRKENTVCSSDEACAAVQAALINEYFRQ